MPSPKAAAPKYPIVLVGPMATGKTAVGEALAALLRGVFRDVDAVFVQQHGAIEPYFNEYGEAAFRELEEQLIAQELQAAAACETAVILSLGGGSLGSAATRAALEALPVVYLETDLATVLPRIARDTGRPMLAGDAAERWLTLFQARREHYERLSQVRIDARHGSPQELAQKIVDALSDHLNLSKDEIA